MQQPLVSVIIPTYKRPHFLKQTLKSVVGQSYSNMEIIVIDDGTPGDENKQMCDDYPRVTYMKVDNSGSPSRPRNIGIKKAKGKYLAFVDDDDIWLQDKIKTQVEILESNNEFGLVHSFCTCINSKGELLDQIVGRPGSPDVKHGNVLTRMIGNWTIMSSTPLINKNIIDIVGYFNETMPHAGEDVEYWSRCAFHTKFFYIDEPLVKYRLHDDNASNYKSAYVNLPVYLFKVVKKKYDEQIINKNIYRTLKLNLSLAQSKSIKKNVLRTIKNLFRIDTLWFVKFRVHKTIIKKMIS